MIALSHTPLALPFPIPPGYMDGYISGMWDARGKGERNVEVSREVEGGGKRLIFMWNINTYVNIGCGGIWRRQGGGHGCCLFSSLSDASTMICPATR